MSFKLQILPLTPATSAANGLSSAICLLKRSHTRSDVVFGLEEELGTLNLLTPEVIVHPGQCQHCHGLFHTTNVQCSEEAEGDNQQQESAGLLTSESP